MSGGTALARTGIALRATISAGSLSSSIVKMMTKSLKTVALNPMKLHKIITNKAMRRLARVFISASDPGFSLLYSGIKFASKVPPYLRHKGIKRAAHGSYLSRETALLGPILAEKARHNYNLRVLNEKLKQELAKKSPYQYVQNRQTNEIKKMIQTSAHNGMPVYQEFGKEGLLTNKYYLDTDKKLRPLDRMDGTLDGNQGKPVFFSVDKNARGQKKYSAFKSKASLNKRIRKPDLDGSVSSNKLKKNLRRSLIRMKPQTCYDLSIKAARAGKSLTEYANVLLSRTKNYGHPYKYLMNISNKTKKTHFDFNEIEHSGFLNFKAKKSGEIQHTVYIHIGPDKQRLLVNTNGLSLDRELFHGGVVSESYRSTNIYEIKQVHAANINDYLQKNNLDMHYTPAYQVNQKADSMLGAPQTYTFVPEARLRPLASIGKGHHNSTSTLQPWRP